MCESKCDTCVHYLVTCNFAIEEQYEVTQCPHYECKTFWYDCPLCHGMTSGTDNTEPCAECIWRAKHINDDNPNPLGD